jgi:uncharacterized coiled-coil protein SlyX
VSEVEDLRRRVAELEAQLAEQARVTNEIVARSQEKLYWLERWGIDLDRVMGRRSAQLALETLKRVRGLVWGAKRAARQLRS